ncbi:hypothetical protein BCR42DRAFT_398671 [Absidia repens]|uniref:Uncharacterized protein n=1 Tax=Absidia repens TaxID=90262 RepID=A0A1X2HXE5_9FUNG|nr:hypothetical protein BCR42DRAFT_398671 [Absidia repens]
MKIGFGPKGRQDGILKTKRKRQTPLTTSKANDSIQIPGATRYFGSLSCYNEATIFKLWILSRNGIVDIPKLLSIIANDSLTIIANFKNCYHYFEPCVMICVYRVNQNGGLSLYSPESVLYERHDEATTGISERLDSHPQIFSDEFLNHCSEQSLIVKFWGAVFENFFGYNDKVFLQWGDSLSTCHKDMGRLCALISELLSPPARQQWKSPLLYSDKLKSVLATKVLLNDILSKMKYLSSSNIKSIKLPMIQIMRLNYYVYAFWLLDHGVYCLQDVCNFEYPRAMKPLTIGCANNMIEDLAMLYEMVSDIERSTKTFSTDTTSTMTKGIKQCIIE